MEVVMDVDKESRQIPPISSEFVFLPRHNEGEGIDPEIRCDAPVSVGLDFVSCGRLGEGDLKSLSKDLRLFGVDGSGIMPGEDFLEVRCSSFEKEGPL